MPTSRCRIWRTVWCWPISAGCRSSIATAQRLVGLVARKDLLRIRATAKSAEVNRVAFFGRGTSPETGDEEQVPLPAKAGAGP